MKKVLFVLTLLALACSPLTVSQANAAPVKHHGLTVNHHRKLLKKKSGVKRMAKSRNRRHKNAG